MALPLPPPGGTIPYIPPDFAEDDPIPIFQQEVIARAAPTPVAPFDPHHYPDGRERTITISLADGRGIRQIPSSRWAEYGRREQPWIIVEADAVAPHHGSF